MHFLPLELFSIQKFRQWKFHWLFLYVLSLSINASAAFYQVNSESLNSPKTNSVLSDLKFIAGYETMDLPWPTFFRNGRIGAGSYSLYQSASDPSYYWRNGLLVQLRTELLINYFYFQYEHHEYKSKNSISEANGTTSNSWNSENRYGVIFSFYETFKKDFFVDTYFESFLIPEVSKNDLLSVLRLTLVYKHFIEPVNPLAEIYLKESPFVFGGQVREIRLGLQWYPTDYASIKLTGNCLPTSAVSSAGILLQLDIFKEGQL